MNKSWNVILISFLILYLELALIRFLPAHILYLGFFTNLVLIASFLGIGLGLLLTDIKYELVKYFPFLLLFLMVITYFFGRGLVLNTSDILFFKDLDSNKQEGITDLILLPFLFTTIAALFASLSQTLGKLFSKSKNPVQTYTFDIIGSILGIVCFYSLSYFSFAPPVWFVLFAIFYFILVIRSFKQFIILLLIFIPIVVLTFDFGKGEFFWSPYQRITLVKNQLNSGGLIMVNNINHQYFSKLNYAPLHALVFSRLKSFVNLDKILIIGSGTGQDVAAAIQAGAKNITAVEIDPKILEIGIKLHPEKPYSDSRVTIVNDDGRHFLANTTEKFDVIIFALTDSLVLNFGLNEVRLESFLFTLEGFQMAKNHLRKDGTFVAYNNYRKEWLIKRLENMLKVVFGDWEKTIYLGDTTRMLQAKISSPGAVISQSNLPKDDWPFLYLMKASIPSIYLYIILAILSISVIVTGLIIKLLKVKDLSFTHAAPFFLMGAAFSLLETKSIVLLNLLFGVTWLVNVVAFTGILLTVLCACLTTLKFKIHKTWLILLLISSLFLQFFIPVNNLLFENQIFRVVTAILYFYLPIFFANLIFANMFAKSKSSQFDLAANLLGLTLGGLLEYSALLFGYSSLILFIGCFYLLAIWFSRSD